MSLMLQFKLQVSSWLHCREWEVNPKDPTSALGDVFGFQAIMVPYCVAIVSGDVTQGTEQPKPTTAL